MTPFTVLLALSSPQSFNPGPNPMILRDPAVNATTIVFQFAGDLWKVPRAGGAAVRLTSAPGTESMPKFSPDGTTIAFSGQYDGNTDVFTVPVEGGTPKRLTAHPAADEVNGWTPDGKSVLFVSTMASENAYTRLFKVSTGGGVPAQLPFPAVDEGSLSPDGSQLAYIPNPKWQAAWKRYRGGQAGPVWIGNLSDSKIKAIPWKGTGDENPMWVGDSIYYLSDPKGEMTLHRYDTKSGKTNEEIAPNGSDIKNASAGPGVIAYEEFGSIWLYDVAKKSATRVPITIDADFPEIRSKYVDLGDRIQGVDISPTGQRIVADSRGFIFTSPASKGDAKVLHSEAGIQRRNPAWSPDGRTIAYFTYQNDKEELALYDTTTGKDRILSIGAGQGSFGNIAWSPDSKKLIYSDFSLGLWVLDIASGISTRIDSLLRRGRVGFEYSWSPDSKWIAYTRDIESTFGALFFYSLESGKMTQVTDGLADVSSPVFDRSGKYVYFLASTDVGLGGDNQDIASYASANVTQNVYCLVLKKGVPNPLAPESDEEKVAPTEAPKAPDTKPAESKPATSLIDLEGLESRIITLPHPKQPYGGLAAGTPGSVLAIALPVRPSAIDAPRGTSSLIRFAFADRRPTVIVTGIGGINVTPDGSKALIQGQGGLSIIPTSAPANPGQGAVTISAQVKIDPATEWRRMYFSAIRQQKIRFYDPKVHGVDLDALGKRYEPFLANLKSRSDLNYLFTEIFGEISVGHMFIGGGDIPGTRGIPGGLLGADYTFDKGRYKLARIFDGERWNPNLYAPLAQPGVDAKVGEYVLAIDGEELTEVMDLYVALEGKAGKQVKLKLGPNADGTDSREVIVLPIANEGQLRNRAWTEGNRKRVEAATGGKVGYVHVPDTNVGGWREFVRYYYSQTGKDAMIIDERHNGGGAIADFLVREMLKPIVSGSRTRYGKDYNIPVMGVFGPKVMIANEMAGSGGDIFPHLFRFHKVGPIIGKKTWGAMISNYGFNLVDGGRISSPDDAMYNPDGTWMIENRGTPPDMEVELDPFLWRQGKDAQLEAAIAEIQKLMAKNPVKPLKRPDYPSIPPFKSTGGR